MSDPKRLLEEGTSELGRQLLRTADVDHPSPDRAARTLAALGLAGATTATTTATFAGVRASLVAKWFVVGAVGAGTVVAASVETRHATEVMAPVASVVVASHLPPHARRHAPSVPSAPAADEVEVPVETAAPAASASAAEAPAPAARVRTGDDVAAGRPARTLPPGAQAPSPRPELRAAAGIPAPARTTDANPVAARAIEPDRAAPPGAVEPPDAIRPQSVDTSFAPPASAATLADEVTSLDRAREALRAGDATTALRRLDEYRVRFGKGSLGGAVTVLRIEALARHGDAAAAADLAERFVAANPHSAFAERARSFVGAREK